MEKPKVLFFEKLFSTTFVMIVRVFLIMIRKSAKKQYRLIFIETNDPNHLFRTWRPKGCVFTKQKFDNICYESSYVSCSDLKVLEKIAPFNFFRNKLSHSFIQEMEKPKVMFFEKLFSTTFVTIVRVFLIMICKSAKKQYRLIFIETNGPNHLFKTWRRQKLCFSKQNITQLL